MTYLFAAYAITWVLIASYMWVIGKRQQKAMEEIAFLQELNDE